MITCPECGTVNADDAVTCTECMFLLKKEALRKVTEPKGVTIPVTKSKFASLDETRHSLKKQADIMFVFDCTGSMHEEIRAMQDAIIDFSSMVKSEGLDIRLGLLEFRDRMVGEEHILHQFGGEVFTKSVADFKKAVNSLEAEGGRPEPESSADALMYALDQKFRDCPNKTIVLITDAPPHLPDKSTKNYEQVIDKMKEKNLNQLYIVTMLTYSPCHIHLRLLEGVQLYGGDGLAFELSKKDDERKAHFIKVLRGLAKSISSKSVAG